MYQYKKLSSLQDQEDKMLQVKKRNITQTYYQQYLLSVVPVEVHSARTLSGGHMMHLALSWLQAGVMMMMIWIEEVININIEKNLKS